MLRAVMAGLICLAAGVHASQRLNGRVCALRSWQRALEKISTQCVCLRLSPKDMLQELPKSHQTELTREEKDWIAECLQMVLNGTQEEQERQLRYAIKRLEQALQTAEEKQKQDAKLFVSLGLLGGLCIFLLCL